MIKRLVYYILTFIGPQLIVAQDYKVQWEYLTDGEGKRNETAHQLIQDEQGNLYVMANSMNNGEQIMLVKYNPSGKVEWTRYYAGIPQGGDYPGDLQLVNGFIYLGFYSMNSSRAYETVILSYNPDGQLKSKYLIKSPGGGDCKIECFTVDVDGNIYVGGRISGTQEDVSYDAYVVKLNSTTQKEEWRLIHKGTSQSEDDGYNKIFVDAFNHIYAAGYYYNTETGNDAVIIKLDRKGTVSWKKIFDNEGRHESYEDLRYSSSLNTISLLGRSGSRTDVYYFIQEVNLEGMINWTSFSSKVHHDIRYWTFDLDESGNVYSAYLNGYGEDSVYLVKYDQKGKQVWSKYHTPMLPQYRAYNPGFKLKVVKDKCFFICDNAEKVQSWEDPITDGTLTIYDLNGAKLFQYKYNSDYNLDDWFKSITIGSDGSIYILGDVNTGDKEFIGKIGTGGEDILLLKLSPIQKQ